jgi:hypothetical protein
VIYIHVVILMKLIFEETMVSMLQSLNGGSFLRMRTVIILMILITLSSESLNETSANDTRNSTEDVTTAEGKDDYDESNIYYIHAIDDDESEISLAEHGRKSERNETVAKKRSKNKYRKNPGLRQAVQDAAQKGLSAMIDLYERKEPEIYRKGSNLKLSKWLI